MGWTILGRTKKKCRNQSADFCNTQRKKAINDGSEKKKQVVVLQTLRRQKVTVTGEREKGRAGGGDFIVLGYLKRKQVHTHAQFQEKKENLVACF